MGVRPSSGETLPSGPSLVHKATEPAEVAMSTATGPVSLIRKPPMSIPVSIWVPLLGLAWVFVNILLVDLGFRIGYQATCGPVPGRINVTLLATHGLATHIDRDHL